jgi:hypothetical protein
MKICFRFSKHFERSLLSVCRSKKYFQQMQATYSVQFSSFRNVQRGCLCYQFRTQEPLDIFLYEHIFMLSIHNSRTVGHIFIRTYFYAVNSQLKNRWPHFYAVSSQLKNRWTYFYAVNSQLKSWPHFYAVSSQLKNRWTYFYAVNSQLKNRWPHFYAVSWQLKNRWTYFYAVNSQLKSWPHFYAFSSQLKNRWTYFLLNSILENFAQLSCHAKCNYRL